MPQYVLATYHQSAFRKPTQLSISPVHRVPVVRSTDKLSSISAQGIYIVHRLSDTVVFERNGDMQLYPASTTKLLTALTVLDMHTLSDITTIQLATREGQLIDLVDGERMTIENLLYGALVHSGNDAATALAMTTGDVGTFVQRMNEKARSIGMRHSYFQNPSGLDEDGQYTTPADLARLGEVSAQNTIIRKITATKAITIMDEDYQHFHTLINVNKLLTEIPGVGGLKTGTTEKAGENLVTFYRTPTNDEYIIAIMKSEDRVADTTTLIDWLNTAIDYVTI